MSASRTPRKRTPSSRYATGEETEVVEASPAKKPKPSANTNPSRDGEGDIKMAGSKAPIAARNVDGLNALVAAARAAPPPASAPLPQFQVVQLMSMDTLQQSRASAAAGDSKPLSAPPSTYSELEQTIKNHGLRIPLPADDVKSFNPNFSLDPVVKNFTTGPLLETMALIEYHCRLVVQSAPAQSDPNAPVSMVDVTKHLLNFLFAVNQLPGWSHIEKYMRSPIAYMAKAPVIPVPQPEPGKAALNAIDELIEKGTVLQKRLLMRLNWVLQLQTEEKKDANSEVYLRVILADRAWASDANNFMKDAEAKVKKMLTDYQSKFHAFRELQRQGVQWPHSASARKAIEAAGFVYRPMMIKRDRCVCETCNVEISGWRPWQNAWAYHDYSKHLPVFLETARVACAGDRPTMAILNETRQRLADIAVAQAASTRAKPPVPLFNQNSGKATAATPSAGK